MQTMWREKMKGSAMKLHYVGQGAANALREPRLWLGASFKSFLKMLLIAALGVMLMSCKSLTASPERPIARASAEAMTPTRPIPSPPVTLKGELQGGLLGRLWITEVLEIAGQCKSRHATVIEQTRQLEDSQRRRRR